MSRAFALVAVVLLLSNTSTPAIANTAVSLGHVPLAVPWDNRTSAATREPGILGLQALLPLHSTAAPGDPVDLSAALMSAADYLKRMQSDITEDNAGNGTDGIDEAPDDPDDGGWDWVVTSPPEPIFHTSAASFKNLYGATALGIYSAYLTSDDASYLTAMTDAADVMAGDADIRSASDVVFLLLYDDLPVVNGTIYADAAKAKFDARIATYGTATGFAEHIRDVRAGDGYENGIIAWDIGAWAVAAAMLEQRYPADPYDYATASSDIAEVIWQDSFNGTPGYFDIVEDAGWDPAYQTPDYWWYTLGITGLMSAFSASGVHTDEIPGLVTRIEASQYPTGAVSYCYGANLGDEDWQSTAYSAMAMARADQAAHQASINHMAYWLGATQDPSGGWKYSNDEHYPEIAGENAAALALGEPPSIVVVDDDFTGQADVDVYNAAHGTGYVWGYDAFGVIQDGVDAVSGSTVYVLPGEYEEQVVITKPLMLEGAGDGLTVIQSPVTLTESFTTGAVNKPVVYVHDANDVTIKNLTVDGLGRGNTNVRFTGIAYYNAGGTVEKCEIRDIRNTPINGAQHGIGIYGYVSAGPERLVNVSGCSVYGFQKAGIVLNSTGLTGHVSGCNIDGYGPAAFIAMNGIQIGYGATGTIANTEVYGCSYTGGGGDGSAGLLLFQPTGPIDVTGNLVEECQVGIRFESVGGTIAGNTVTATPVGTGLTSYWNIVADPGAGPARQPTSSPFDAGLAHEGGQTATGGFAKSIQALTTVVHRNTVDGGGIGTGIEADALGTETLNFTATENIATHFTAALVLDKDAGATLNATIRDNSFTTSTYGLYNKTGAAHDARANYWGHLTGPLEASMNSTGLGTEISGTPTTGDVLYAPWLCLTDGDLATAGYQRSAPMTWGMNTQTTFLDAYNSFTVSGDAVYMRPGTYPEGPQVTIDHDITVFGEDEATTIMVPTANTGGTGDARGWFLVPTGRAFNLSNVTLDGAGFNIYQAIRSFGPGTIDNCTVRNISFAAYIGIGIVMWDADMTVSNCTFSNIERIGVFPYGAGVTDAVITGNTYTGKGPGDWLDYGAEIGGGARARIYGNNIANCQGVASSDGSASAGVLMTTYYGPGTAGTLEDNSLSDCSNGVVVGYGSTDASAVTAVNGNLFSDNDAGLVTSASPTISVTVYGNMFSNSVNAEDNTAGGDWDDGGSVGNCWSDFATNAGYPAHYFVGGSAGAIDDFPNRDLNSCPFCACPFQSDFDEDGFLTALDLAGCIDILFAGRLDQTDPTCPIPRADFDCDGFSTALDLAGLIDHLFAGGDGPCNLCVSPPPERIAGAARLVDPSMP